MIVKQRKAFSLITAIFLILIMASVSMFVMSLSGKMVQGTTVQYQKEQAVILAKSYTELAIMTVMANVRDGGTCIENISGVNVQGGFNADVRIGYIGPAGEIGSCSAARQLDNPSGNTLNIVVDTYIEYQDVSDPRANPPWITYHRRTLQKI
ncbi:MAG: type II secretion system protein [Sulfurimonas sp.]